MTKISIFSEYFGASSWKFRRNSTELYRMGFFRQDFQKFLVWNPNGQTPFSFLQINSEKGSMASLNFLQILSKETENEDEKIMRKWNVPLAHCA